MQAIRPNLELCAGVRLSRALGKGSCGEVWEATRLDGPAVAVKFIAVKSGREAAREIKAIQAVRGLQHDHLALPDQVTTMPGYVIVVMPLGDGTLADLRAAYHTEDGTPIPAEETCAYLSQVAHALDFLNTRQHRIDGRCVGIQHGAVKGSNLLLFGDIVKLSDFEQNSSTSVPSPLLLERSRLDYAAPEIFEGYLTTQSDQHALAITYCELRGGRLPFPPMHDFANSWPQRRPPPDLGMLLPAEQAIVARALQRVPQDRWPSCSEFLAALTRAVA